VITLITGSPGAGKTAGVVDLLMTTYKDRPTFVLGLNGLKLPHEPLADGHRWHLDVPDGSLVVIDEVQQVWRPRGPGQAVPDHIKALETHRHRGIDFLLTTQGPNLLDTNVRSLVGRHIHMRDVGLLGRYWYEWPECADNPKQSWKTAPFKKRFALPKKAFTQYKSASMHIKPERSFPLMLAVAVGSLLLMLVLGWYAVKSLSGKMDAKPASPTTVPTSSAPGLTAAGAPGVGQQKRVIDDRVDWVPRISHRPESAPAYDHLRQVVAMPVVVGGFCMEGKCRCFTQQGTDPGLSAAECHAWIQNPPFDAYRVAQQLATYPWASTAGGVQGAEPLRQDQRAP
jgi:zona occludens toxin